MYHDVKPRSSHHRSRSHHSHYSHSGRGATRYEMRASSPRPAVVVRNSRSPRRPSAAYVYPDSRRDGRRYYTSY